LLLLRGIKVKRCEYRGNDRNVTKYRELIPDIKALRELTMAATFVWLAILISVVLITFTKTKQMILGKNEI